MRMILLCPLVFSTIYCLWFHLNKLVQSDTLFLYLQSQASGNIVRSVQSGISTSRERRFRIGIPSFFVYVFLLFSGGLNGATHTSNLQFSLCLIRFSLMMRFPFYCLFSSIIALACDCLENPCIVRLFMFMQSFFCSLI